MLPMNYVKAKENCEKLIDIFNECNSEKCRDCPINSIIVAVENEESATVCHLLAFYKRYLENKIAEALR